jgi:hypothetical protein
MLQRPSWHCRVETLGIPDQVPLVGGGGHRFHGGGGTSNLGINFVSSLYQGIQSGDVREEVALAPCNVKLDVGR